MLLEPVLLVATLLAQGPPPPRPEAPPAPVLRLADHLALTSDQVTRLQACLQQHEPSLQQKRKAAEQARRALGEALQDPATGEARLKELHEKAAAAQFGELSERHALLKEQVALLTPEQAVKFRSALSLLKSLEGPQPRHPRPDFDRKPQGIEPPPPFREPHGEGE